MNRTYPVIASVFILLAVESCSKKTVPNKRPPAAEIIVDSSMVVKKSDSVAVIKPVTRKPKEKIPKVVVVNDKFASKSVDGRYYYDLQGHRYWRNNNDGKYYLFNKSMLTDDAFKKPN